MYIMGSMQTSSRWGKLVLFVLLAPAVVANNYDNGGNGNGGNADDDDFIDLSSQDLDKVSIMPVSCVN